MQNIAEEGVTGAIWAGECGDCWAARFLAGDLAHFPSLGFLYPQSRLSVTGRRFISVEGCGKAESRPPGSVCWTLSCGVESVFSARDSGQSNPSSRRLRPNLIRFSQSPRPLSPVRARCPLGLPNLKYPTVFRLNAYIILDSVRHQV